MSKLLVVALLLAGNVTYAAEPVDKDRQILELRRALAAEKIERLRLEYLIIKAEHDKIDAELKKAIGNRQQGTEKAEDKNASD